MRFPTKSDADAPGATPEVESRADEEKAGGFMVV